MAQGKKTPPAEVYKIIAVWAVTQSYAETARRLNMNEKTVEGIVKENKDKPDFAELLAKTKRNFSQNAESIIEDGMLLLARRMKRAIECEEELDDLLDEVYFSDKEEISHEEKKSLISKIRSLELHDIRAITTAIGTLYDKKALADGKPTASVSLVGDDTLDVMAKLAGYERKQ